MKRLLFILLLIAGPLLVQAQEPDDSISLTELTTTDFLQQLEGGTLNWRAMPPPVECNICPGGILHALAQWMLIKTIITFITGDTDDDDGDGTSDDSGGGGGYTNNYGDGDNDNSDWNPPPPEGGGGGSCENCPPPAEPEDPWGNNDEPGTNTEAPVKDIREPNPPVIKDCAGVENGTAFKDSCGICVGGTTGKLPCKDTTQSTPCDSLKKAAQFLDSIYAKSKIDSVLNTIPDLNTLTVEKGFPIFQKFSVNPFNVHDTTFTSTFKAGDVETGTDTSIQMNFDVPYLHILASSLHTHPPRGYNAHSVADIYKLIEEKQRNPRFVGAYVAAYNGNKYAIAITDTAMAKAFLNTKNQYLDGAKWKELSDIDQDFKKATKFFMDKYITISNRESLAYEMAMAAVLKQYKTGISLNKRDVLGSFQPIVVNTIKHPEKPKRKFYVQDCL